MEVVSMRSAYNSRPDWGQEEPQERHERSGRRTRPGRVDSVPTLPTPDAATISNMLSRLTLLELKMWHVQLAKWSQWSCRCTTFGPRNPPFRRSPTRSIGCSGNCTYLYHCHVQVMCHQVQTTKVRSVCQQETTWNNRLCAWLQSIIRALCLPSCLPLSLRSWICHSMTPWLRSTLPSQTTWSSTILSGSSGNCRSDNVS